MSSNERPLLPTYHPPRNFAEFFWRYPDLVPNRIAGKWGGVRSADRGDLIQAVYTHLLSLPEDSDHRERGCTDLISTFNADLLPECSERLFIGYILLIVDNYVRKQHRHNRNRIIERTDSIVDLAARSENAPEDAFTVIMGMARSTDPLAGLRYEEFCSAAYAIHPILAWAAVELSVRDKQTDVCAWMGISKARLANIIRHLRYLAQGNVAMARRFTWRREYAPRRRQGDTHAK